MCSKLTIKTSEDANGVLVSLLTLNIFHNLFYWFLNWDFFGSLILIDYFFWRVLLINYSNRCPLKNKNKNKNKNYKDIHKILSDINSISICLKHEIQFSTRFSTTFSTNIWKISILVPFWANINHKTYFTQNTLRSSFISQKICALHRRCF